MDLQRVLYSGRKQYNDKPAKTTWHPGDIKPVTKDTARRLKKFAEFKDAGDSVTQQNNEVAESAAVIAIQTEIDHANQQVRHEVEGILLTIESMDKGALEAYAEKYEVSIDKRKRVEDLRSQVTGLVEQFGVR